MTFSFDTIEDFDSHISNSIPNYSTLTEMILSVTPFITMPYTSIIDIGAGTCELLNRIDHDANLKYAIEPSAHLLYQNDFRLHRWNKTVEDSLNILPTDASLIMSIFTLQFIRKDKRQEIVNKIHESLVPNGGFIWAEKVRCDHSLHQEMLTFAHYDLKRKVFTADEILDKEQDLRRLMRPNTTVENLQIARNAGFKNIPLLMWKMFNFECYLFRKES